MNPVCYECKRHHHRSCRRSTCECFCRWPSSQQETRLLVGCYCESHFFNLPAEMVRRGETVSCGDGCG